MNIQKSTHKYSFMIQIIKCVNHSFRGSNMSKGQVCGSIFILPFTYKVPIFLENRGTVAVSFHCSWIFAHFFIAHITLLPFGKILFKVRVRDWMLSEQKVKYQFVVQLLDIDCFWNFISTWMQSRGSIFRWDSIQIWPTWGCNWDEVLLISSW